MFFRKKKPALVPLHLCYTEPPRTPKRLEAVAHFHVGVGEGLKMLSAQAANEALRHCRIGVVTLKNA